GAEPLHPPTSVCIFEGCGGRKLSEEIRVEGWLYTLHRGALPIWYVSLYCRGCLTRYYPTYFVTHASNPTASQEYYGGIPEYINVTEASFISRDLGRYIAIEMSISQSSAESIARVYNLAINNSTVPNASRLKMPITGYVVLDGFFMHALLQDKERRNEKLKLPHSGLQEDRLNQSLQERNYRMAGTGQEMWAHACNVCQKTYTETNGMACELNAGVTDGIVMGHPCCSVRDCQLPLVKQNHRFCSIHSSLTNVCCVADCFIAATPGYKTCDSPTHL
ncbi:hypothetical protein BD410DRAFT_723567, partial [Rickenella mellea]